VSKVITAFVGVLVAVATVGHLGGHPAELPPPSVWPTPVPGPVAPLGGPAAALPLAPSAPHGEPLACPQIVLTQGYGPVDNPIEPAVHGAAHFHTGWDFACPTGTPIYSVTGGAARVDLDTGCGVPGASGFGRNVQVHTGSDWVRYGHMSTVLVKDGQAVSAGTELGLVGSTGCSTGPHLHFEVDRGCATVTCSIDPANLIALPPGIGG
jgi:murein DD-endopeptidase MepM/ murein hydrolase activator NlpD